MAAPNQKLAKSLEILRSLHDRGVVAVRPADLGRIHRERLIKNGFLQKVMKGWYIPAQPDAAPGDSTGWYISFWKFSATYLKARFGKNWSLSPEQSLLHHVGNMMVPRQLLVRSPKARNNITLLPHHTSLFDMRAALPESAQTVEREGMRLFSLPAALAGCSPGFFVHNATDVRAALALVRDASELLPLLLEGGRTVVAGRLAGAFRNVGLDIIADEIIKTMQAANFDVREKNPFEDQEKPIPPILSQSPYVSRIRLMWRWMRDPVLRTFPEPPGTPPDVAAYLKSTDDMYMTDAYHSLSIEGYRVTPELIERVRSGAWSPEGSRDDRDQRDALVARGYWQAYQVVRKSVRMVLKGENSGDVTENSHREWYRELFGPSVTAGLLRPADLAGYRNDPVHIRRSMHVPPRAEAVRDCMPAFFDLLRNEPEPAVRIVLGHFMFVYIHPYMDGNGRMGRFLMNVMLASGGYPWTVIPVEKRDEYMDSLEAGSVKQDIAPFADFLGGLVVRRLVGS